MANNRMFLVHARTGNAVIIGKRMLDGWYDVPTDIKQRIEMLFDSAGSGDGSDDFRLAMEDAKLATGATDKWIYSDETSPGFSHRIIFL